MEVGEVIAELKMLEELLDGESHAFQDCLAEAIRLLDTLRPRLQSEEPAPGDDVLFWSEGAQRWLFRGDWIPIGRQGPAFWLPLPPAPAGKEVSDGT